MSEQSILDKLVVRDSPGKVSVADMRLLFEAAITSTPKLSALPLEADEKSAQFHYVNHATDHAWFGFALGLRCAERVELNGQFVAARLRPAKERA